MKNNIFTTTIGIVFILFTLTLVSNTGEVTAYSGESGDGDMGGFRGPCGQMDIIMVEGKGNHPVPMQSSIIDSWTTTTPHIDPWNEVYDIQIGVDSLAFVTEYYFEEGGYIPLQYIRVWDCGTYHKRSTCQYDWTIGPLPPGFTWLLVNYYPPESVPNVPGTYDWATRVGDSTFGYPDPMNVRPWCFTLSP